MRERKRGEERKKERKSDTGERKRDESEGESPELHGGTFLGLNLPSWRGATMTEPSFPNTQGNKNKGRTITRRDWSGPV